MASPPSSKDHRYVVGVCAMDVKARSKPMRNILSRLMALGNFDVQVFGDKVILDEDIASWPQCNFLVSFFSAGFPMQKAIEYVQLRRPYLVNDLDRQQLLFDRRLILRILDAVNVPTPRRVVVNRDVPELSDDVWETIKRSINADLRALEPLSLKVEQPDYDTLTVDGVTITKPFVEKPVFGEDHNVYVYFHSSQGGGVRKLFRKIANKSSEYVAEEWKVRDTGSYVYEEFMDVDNAEDVKVYTIGPNYAHAETRKSPVVDGVVRRNHDGKEVRYVAKLTDVEKEMARQVCIAFGQAVCGFDLLRVNGASYVIDVNGWSFVKGNEEYYDNCANILKRIFMTAVKRRKASLTLTKEISFDNQWKLKAFLAVIRHGDRTPKLKLKFNFSSASFVALLDNGKEEKILKKQKDLQRVLDAIEEAQRLQSEKEAKLEQLKSMINKKIHFSGTKVQVKPTWNKENDNLLDKLQVIVKWGGEFTHAGHHHSKDSGENLRKELLLINRALLDDVKVYTASEHRVIETADVFTRSFLDLPSLEPNFLQVRKDMLDDSTAAKEQMDSVKIKLQETFNLDMGADKHQVSLPRELEDPSAFIENIIDILRQLRTIMRVNFQTLDINTIQEMWCCSETPGLFRERWEKLFQDFCDVGRNAFDPSKVSELYDSVKYDALHNREFIERIFASPGTTTSENDATLVTTVTAPPPPPSSFSSTIATPIPIPATTATSMRTSSFDQAPSHVSIAGLEIRSRTSSGYISPTTPISRQPELFRDLYRRAKILFDFVAPSEYGMADDEKLEIGMLTSMALVKQIVEDLRLARDAAAPCTRLFFTKESHVHTLLNIVFLCGLPKKIFKADIDELDYLTQIAFELYERDRGLATENKEYSLRVSFSPGAFCAHVVDLQIDTRHSLSVAPRRDLTDHVSLDEAFSCFLSQIKEQL